MLIIHNPQLTTLLKNDYQVEDVQRIYDYLESKGTFNFPALCTGLFSAGLLGGSAEYTGYDAAWVRDNVHVANALYVRGEIPKVVACLGGLMKWFRLQGSRLDHVIATGEAPADQMERPHIRFDGREMKEIDERWNHAQNDALGYFLWLYCTLVRDGHIEPAAEDMETVAALTLYLHAVSYWQDEDSGHWEEPPKVEASSIGPVVKGLEMVARLIRESPSVAKACQYRGEQIRPVFVEELAATGRAALDRILPLECVQPEPDKNRPYDGALLFLVNPLDVVGAEVANLIVTNVERHLKGPYGIRRYLGDSFWCRDYKDIPPEIRTALSTERDAWFAETGREPLRPGEEAQWCIFDSILSAIYGEKYRRTGHSHDLKLQIHYLNRAIGQVTGEESVFGAFRCPELYYLQDGRHIANDVVPLLWAQANLSIALKKMEESLG